MHESEPQSGLGGRKHDRSYRITSLFIESEPGSAARGHYYALFCENREREALEERGRASKTTIEQPDQPLSSPDSALVVQYCTCNGPVGHYHYVLAK